MKNIENCIQLKIDQLIRNSNSESDSSNNQTEEVNEVTTLIAYNHCLDLFDFLQLYSKIQKNELLFQIAVLYDILGYNKLSLEYVNKSLIIIPNVPTIILFKSVLYASMDKSEEAQKCLLKYKYLIGESIYYNYIYNNIRILYFYLLDYEENIVLREIDIIENKYPTYYRNNIVLFFIKSKMFHKLSEKFKRIDKKRSDLYEKESIQNKEKVFNNRRKDAEYLYNKDISMQNITKLLIMIYPNLLEYKPKPLVQYNQNFHSGFGLFFTLIKLCKIFKFKIQVIKYKKKNSNKFKNSKNNLVNENRLDYVLNIIKNDSTEMSGSNSTNINEILSMSKSLWLTDFISNSNDIPKNSNNIIQNKKICQKNSIKQTKSIDDFNINNIEDKIKTNYYIYKGYYSNLNIKESILKNINFNNEYKEKILRKDSFLDDINEDFRYNIKINKSNDNIIFNKKYSFIEENEVNIFNNKLIKNNNEKYKKNHYKIKLIQSTQNKHTININKNNNKDKIIKVKINTDNSIEEKKNKKSINKDKDKIPLKKNINNYDDIKNKNSFKKRNSKISNSNKNFADSYKHLINSNDFYFKKDNKNNEELKNIYKNSKDNNINNNTGKNKKEKKKGFENIKLSESRKHLMKNTKNTNSVKNIFNNIIIFGSSNMYLSRNNTKPYINSNNNNNNNQKTTDKKNKNSKTNESIKEEDLTIVNELEKNLETKNDINNHINNNENNNNNENDNKLCIYQYQINNINYDTHSQKDKNIININNTGRNDKVKDLGKFYIKKIDNTKKYKKAKLIDKINQTEKIDNKTHKNLDKVVYTKSSINQNLQKYNIIRNTPKYLQKTINKKVLTLEKSPYNTISLKEIIKTNKNNNSKKNINYIKYNNINKILNNNIHNKKYTYLESRHMKDNPKSENKKKCQLSIQEKANYLTINLDLLSKSKVCTPTYQKISFFGSFRSDSKDKKKENPKKTGITKLNINSPAYMIRLKRKFKNNKNKINYNGPMSSFNKYVNNNLVKKSTHYFNKIINVSEYNKNKNASSYKLKHSSTNKSISKNFIKTMS